MKVVVILIALLTLGIIVLEYMRTKRLKKLFISLVGFVLILSFAVLGSFVKQIVVLLIVHYIFIIIAWGGLFVYLFRDRLYIGVIASPIITLGTFVILEFLVGAG